MSDSVRVPAGSVQGQTAVATLDALVSKFCVAVGEPIPVDALAAISRLRAENERLREALIVCATESGADVSDGPPTSPPVEVWAVQEVKQLRADYDEALAGSPLVSGEPETTRTPQRPEVALNRVNQPDPCAEPRD